MTCLNKCCNTYHLSVNSPGYLGSWGGLLPQTVCISEWPILLRLASSSSPSWCDSWLTRLRSSCRIPRNCGTCWAATSKKRTITALAPQLATGQDEPSSGRTGRRSFSCTTSWGAAFIPPPQTWSTWWDLTHKRQLNRKKKIESLISWKLKCQQKQTP